MGVESYVHSEVGRIQSVATAGAESSVVDTARSGVVTDRRAERWADRRMHRAGGTTEMAGAAGATEAEAVEAEVADIPQLCQTPNHTTKQTSELQSTAARAEVEVLGQPGRL